MNDSRRHVGPYAVEGEIGRGGMGVVYRATDTRLGRAVAIKVLPEGVASDQERLARFEREAKLLASLNHQVLGPDFSDTDFVLEPETLHMGLIAADIVERHLEELLRPLRTNGRAGL